MPPAVRSPRSSRALALGLVGLFLLAAVALAFVLSGDDGASGTAASVSDRVTVSGGGLPPAEGPADTAVGRPAPGLAGQGLDGGDLAIVADDGRPKALLFLAHWCPHCRDEVPVVQQWLSGGGLPADVDLYAVVSGTDPGRPNYPPGAWLAREGWTPTTLLDDDEDAAARAYGLTGYPFWVLIDGQGRVAVRHAGALPTSELQGALSLLADG